MLLSLTVALSFSVPSQAILVGSGIPFAMYLVWELVILGTVAPGTSLTSASQIVEQLSAATGGQAGVFVEVFSCFAIITSFLGVGMGCIDFLKASVCLRMHKGDGKTPSGG